MFDTLLSTIAPHLCYGCHKIGTILCPNCKYNISSEYFNGCLLCDAPTLGENICRPCTPLFERAWCVSERRDVLKEILDSYKFKRMYAARQTLAELLVERIPVLPSTVTVVPIPTVPSHIRQRGYDHALSMARIVAKRKKVKLDPLLRRKTLTVQTGTSRKERQQQAKAAFELKKTDLSGIYLLLDDVVTTGATLKAAASLLRQHGADEVWAAVIVRQPIDS